MYIRTDYEISLCPAIRLAGGRSAENGPNLRQIQVATTSNRLYVIYYELITTLSRLLSETLVASAIELLLKATLLRPVVYGLVHHDGLAEIIVDQTLGPAPFNRYQKLMAHLFVELAGIDIKVVSRDSVSMPLLSECTEIQKLRNNIVHRGSQCTSEQAESGAKVSRAAYELIVVPMLRSLGLTVVERGAIVLR